MNILKEITTFIGWLSGSLAGIAAIFYACGYLITKAQLHLLGIGSFISYSRDQYIQEGAKFVVEMADLAGRISLPLLIVAIIIAALFFLARKTGLGRLTGRGKSWLAAVNERNPWLWRTAIFALLLVLLIYLAGRELSAFGAPLAISDLLFAPSAAEGSETAQIREWLTSGDRANLGNLYFNLTLTVLKGGVVFFLAWRVASPWRLRFFLTAPFAITFMLSLLLLPMVYGVLKRPARFARIAVDSDNRMLQRVSGELFLLDKSGEEFVLWDSGARKVIWLPRSEVKSAVISQARFLFDKK
ncbi:MAG TPA: hypothetical protein VI298_15075 [Geobacteraceae bacterium]